MKNIILSFLVSLLFTSAVNAQNWDKAIEPTSGFASVSEAAGMAREIVKAAGVKANFLIAEAPVPNAMAVVHAGKRYVLYNPDFIDILTRATGTKWAAVSVLAHEIGHHLYTNSVNKGKIPLATELEADEFSGFVLAKLGADLDDAQAAMKILATRRATSTHPARDQRINSIAYGYRKAGGNAAGNLAVAGTNSAGEQTSENVLPEKNILASIKFDLDPSGQYYVTSRMNVVKVNRNKLYIVGKLSRINDRDFPFMIHDENNNRIYIQSSGEIYNRTGTKVGKMQVYNS